MRKAYISGGSRFQEGKVLGCYGFTTTETIEDADLVVFTGGADIGPNLYFHPTHTTTYPTPHRDAEDVTTWAKATALGIPMLGICRGAQFICAMTGGTLWQDVKDHCGSGHYIVDVETGEQLYSNSVHHQVMRPGDGAITQYVSKHACKATRWCGETNQFITEEIWDTPEIVLYPEHKAICVQGHPEFDTSNTALLPFRKLVFSLVDSFQPSLATTPLALA